MQSGFALRILEKSVCGMLRSMTGFGRSEATNKERKITVEIKSVNHRYLDLSIKLPKKLSFFEASIRNILKQYISRGKVDVFITYEDYTQNDVCLKYNEKIAAKYIEYANEMAQKFKIEQDISTSVLSRMPEVLTLEEQSVDEEQLWSFVEQPLAQAARRLVESRVTEGSNLKVDLFGKLDEITEKLEQLECRGPEIVNSYRQKLISKIEELLGDKTVDEAMLATEITLYADKICVDEETVRLKSHISHMKETLNTGENIGRKLDFIAQEMNREANTILSKANDLTVSNLAIDIKTCIEKIREQIQNIE